MRSCSRSVAGVWVITVRFGLAGAAVDVGDAVSNRFERLPQADSVNARQSRAGAAERLRPVIPSRRPERSITSATALVEPANSRPALQSAPPGALPFVARRAPRQSRGHESVGFRGT